MRRTLTLILGVALFGILAAVVVASQGADDPVGTTDTVTETIEHPTTVEDNPKRERADDDAQGGVDISGPCDEAEHANDPRCTGAPSTRVDNSGPGSQNSGPGSVNSGRDDDDGDDDHSGHGGGGDDD
jgi:hypothetical protein